MENSYWNEEQLFSFFRGLALTIVENGMEDGIAQLAEFLPAMTKKGSGDDVTCSGIINMPKLSACSDGIREDLAEAAAIAEEAVPENMEYDDETSQQVISDIENGELRIENEECAGTEETDSDPVNEE